VGSGGFGDAGGGDGRLHGALDDMVALVMAADDAGAWVGGKVGGGKDMRRGEYVL
jgi:hypothetical protein